ncbi:cytoplasmic tRNA 2-thiolation protein 2 isoform X4 [Pipistrellus kuhlii]|uniref:cytoplasmic tRNA 2-thiolation protein 2 isoform X4 n=1 Tax=Pipistrellus kuhlii TaxID=59472 RepID=UPI00174EFA80|nr:cytoplasmic tRNA 2-thiolation protein 2 isoform X4 [Pipistrellus kuhlii]
MCQVGEDYGAPAPEMPPPPRAGRELKCVKCKEDLPVVVIRAGDAFCRDCFKAFYVHKFRAVLGKNRLIFPGEKVLLAWSGGPSSSSMIWQVLEGLSRDSAKRLRFVPGIVYVDEGAACGQSPGDRARTLAEMKLILQTVGFPWHIVALEEVFSLPPSVLRYLAQEPSGTKGAYKAAVDSFLQQQHAPAEGEEQLSQPGSQDPQSPAGPPTAAQTEAQPPTAAQTEAQPPTAAQTETQPPTAAQTEAQPPTAAQTEALSRLFDSVKTLTAKEELLQTLRTHLILHVARTHGYSKVMTGDSCTRLAIKLMTSLALGRGAFLAWDTGFSDERHGDVVVVRPMREHTLKEVAFYNRLFAVPSVFTPAIDTKAPEKSSIHRLMEAFMLRLQAQFPSTVSTVYRTSEKLVKAPRHGSAGGPPGPRCLLCMCALDIDTADSATAFGAQTSHLSHMQPPTPPAEAPTTPCCSAGVGRAQGCCQGAEPCRREDPRAHVIEQLCYGCRVNMKDLPSLDPLPPYILTEAQFRSQRASVLQEMQEYLIDSDDEAQTGES